MRRFVLSLVLVALCAPQLAAETFLYAVAAAENRIDGYLVGGNGLLSAVPMTQRGTRAGPRRVIANGCTLYVVEIGQTEVFHIEKGGGLRLIGATRKSDDSHAHDVDLSPDGKTLYVPFRRTGALASYPLDDEGKPNADVITEDGVPAGGPTSCVYVPGGADWEDIAVANGRVYGAYTNRIVVYGTDETGRLTSAAPVPKQNKDGTFDDEATQCPAFAPTPSGTIQECLDFNVEPRPDRPENCPLSFRASMSGTVGIIVDGTTLVSSQRFAHTLLGFTLGTDGLFMPYGDNPVYPTKQEKKKERRSRKKNRTGEEVFYIGLTAFRPDADGKLVIYAAGYSGRTDAFRLDDNGILPKGLTSTTNRDRVTTPVRTAVGVSEQGDGMLYVAAGELDRIRVFHLREHGAINPDDPTQTNELTGSFPNDVVLADITNCN